MKEFKIRASACSKIMAGEIGLTDKQKERLAELELRNLGQGKPLTANMLVELDTLTFKRDNPELPAGAKTYCKQWVKQQIYGRKKEFTSKYTEKGNMVEEQSFEMIREHFGFNDCIKNEEFFVNDFAHGTPDLLFDFGIDAKNSWDCFSFPLFDDEVPYDENYWQGQTYMWLTGMELFKFVYVLSDTPERLIKQEARSYCFKNGYDLSPEIMQEFTERMTYPNIDMQYRIKVFDVERNESDIKKIEERVLMCRKYISELTTPKTTLA